MEVSGAVLSLAKRYGYYHFCIIHNWFVMRYLTFTKANGDRMASSSNFVDFIKA